MKKTIWMGALILTAGMAQEPRQMLVLQPGEFGGTTFSYAKSEMVGESAVVKGAPYSAEATTETTQTLADGNHVRRTTKTTLYRDSQGRTRREQTLGAVGPLAARNPIQTVVINDPVAGAAYMLVAGEKAAYKMKKMHENPEAAAKAAAEMNARAKAELRTEAVGVVTADATGHTVHVTTRTSPLELKNVQKESLGTQMIEGVAADGTRLTTTIPAGAIGNDQPIVVVNETWYSSQLHATVMSRTTDPRMGETVYKLTNVRLEEPPQSLFTVPADYTVHE